MPDLQFKFEIKDERTLTVPVPTTENDTEQFGKFLVNAGQDGYSIKAVDLVTEERGTQRDPWQVTKGVKVTVAK